jgi:putative ABC transport system permease protein
MNAVRCVPIARRQLAAEPAKLVVTLVAVAAAVTLVLLLAGLRRGMGEQVTLYLDHQPPVLVAQAGARNFLSQTSVLPESLANDLELVPGVAEATPISQQYAMLRPHGRPVLAVLIGYDPGKPGGPWKLASGRAPSRGGELVLDRVLASEHGLEVGSMLEYRGARLRIVGLSSGTSGFMTPLAFAPRRTVNALSRQPGTANFILVRPKPPIGAETMATRIGQYVPGISARTRDELASNDRRQFTDRFSAPLLAMVAIAFAVAILVIGLAVYSSTAERSREYATLKALGLGSAALYRLVGMQAGTLALGGTVLGIALAAATARGVSALAPKYLIAISAGNVAAIAASALAMALLAAFVPARLLARLDPASAFRR